MKVMENKRFNFKGGKLTKSNPALKIYTQVEMEVISTVISNHHSPNTEWLH
jgi:hypothetical protein